MRLTKITRLLRKEHIKARPDGLFRNLCITKFTNKLMRSGKKTVIEKILHPILIDFKVRTSSENMSLFLTSSVEMIKLPIEMRLRRRGREFIQVPFPVKTRRQYLNGVGVLVNEIKSGIRTAKFAEVDPETNKETNQTVKMPPIFKAQLKKRIIACFCTLNKNKSQLEQNIFYKNKIAVRELIQEHKSNKRFR